MSLTLASQPNPNHSGVKDVSPEEVRKHKESLTLVDVRRQDEWKGEFGHIPGATLVTLNTLPEHIEDLPTDKPIVFICRSGGRSGQAAAFALQTGIENVYNMQGGMIAWTQKSFEVEDQNAQ